jgi:type IV secretory pathway VirJ component
MTSMPIRTVAAERSALASLVLAVSMLCTATTVATEAAATTHAAPAAPASPASAAAGPPPAPLGAAHLSHGRFQDVATERPAAAPKRFVLFLSGDGGWNADTAAIAEQLVRHGAMVAGIDAPKLMAAFETDGADCIFPDGDLENLSHFVQAYYHLPTYLTPFLLGYDSGAALAYATLVQAPTNTFAGVLTLGFCPISNVRKPLCRGSGIESVLRPGARGLEFLPAKKLENPWVLLQGERDQACPPSVAGRFIANIPGAAMAVLPQVGSDYAAQAMAPLLAAFDTLVKHTSSLLAPAVPAGLGGLPVIEVPAQPGQPPTDAFAIILSGDGGWAGLDKDVAAALSAHGIPVIGLDSLRYFWSARTPEGLAADMDRMIRYYSAHLNKKRVLLIGYSQGADVLPFAVNRLPTPTRTRVALAALMGMSEHALFEFHVSNWLSSGNSGPPTLPEVNRIVAAPVLCIYGEDEHDSLCPKLDPHKVRVVKLKGGHHFDGDYAGLAQEILAAAHP